MHIVGGSGHGKTQLLQKLILNDLQREHPPSLIIIDSQGEMLAKVQRAFPVCARSAALRSSHHHRSRGRGLLSRAQYVRHQERAARRLQQEHQGADRSRGHRALQLYLRCAGGSSSRKSKALHSPTSSACCSPSKAPRFIRCGSSWKTVRRQSKKPFAKSFLRSILRRRRFFKNAIP